MVGGIGTVEEKEFLREGASRLLYNHVVIEATSKTIELEKTLVDVGSNKQVGGCDRICLYTTCIERNCANIRVLYIQASYKSVALKETETASYYALKRGVSRDKCACSYTACYDCTCLDCTH